jgi:hypothetical protein
MAKTTPKPTTLTESFTDYCVNLMGILRDAFYAIEDGRLYTPDNAESETLLTSAQSLWWRSKGIIPDDRRDNLRKAVADAVEWILSWQGTDDPMLTPDQTYRHQEIILAATSSLQEIVLDDNDTAFMSKPSLAQPQGDKKLPKLSLAILFELDDSETPLTVDELMREVRLTNPSAHSSDTTYRKYVNQLIEMDYAYRPDKGKSGVAITALGEQAIRDDKRTSGTA